MRWGCYCQGMSSAYGVLGWDITDSTLLTAGARYQEMDNDGYPLVWQPTQRHGHVVYAF